MESILVKIQDTIAKYADVLSKISRVDVEVVDNRLYRVAGTGMFSELVNQDMSAEGYVYRQVLKTGRRQIIYSPGRELICQNCPHYNDCQEEIEIS
ncbi:AAA family ATPase, partial [Lacrimispora saccharolytica]|nr:AAA family ATPase [Lacrimispora saccharolytica]